MLSAHEEQLFAQQAGFLKRSSGLAGSHGPPSLHNDLLSHEQPIPCVRSVGHLDLGKSEHSTSFNPVFRFMGKNCLRVSTRLSLALPEGSQAPRIKGTSSVTVTVSDWPYCTVFIWSSAHSTEQPFSLKIRKKTHLNTEPRLNKRLTGRTMPKSLAEFQNQLLGAEDGGDRQHLGKQK